MQKLIIWILFLTFVFGASPKVKLKYPKAHSKLKVNEIVEIRWSSKRNSSDMVALFYSVDNKKNWNPISVTIDDGSFDWVVPQHNSDSCFMKVKLFDQEIEDVSQSPFTINGPFLRLVFPNGGEVFKGLDEVKLVWESSEIQNDIQIYYSCNKSYVWENISTVNVDLGHYYWVIPEVAQSQPICNVKIESTDEIFDITDNSFSIESKIPEIKIISPQIGGIYPDNKPIDISWETTNLNSGYVKLFYSIDGGNNWKRIRSRIKDMGSFLWKIPTIESEKCRIKIVDVNNNSISVKHDADFYITDKPSIAIKFPINNETISSQSNVKITWESVKMDNHLINMYISYNNGSTWETIGMDLENTGIYDWETPIIEEKSGNISLKIMDAKNSNNFSQVNGLTILGNPIIEIVKPDASGVFEANSQFKIQWVTINFNPKTVDIFYTLNNTDWIPIQLESANIGTIYWQTPDDYSKHCQIKISSTVDSELIYSISDQFTITNYPSIMFSPVDIDHVAPSTRVECDWEVMNLSDRNYNIYFKSNKSPNWQFIRNVKGIEKYVWEVPELKYKEDYFLKVESNSNHLVYDVSEKISVLGEPWIEIINPKFEEDFSTDIPVLIKWNHGNLKSLLFDVLFSKDNGQVWVPIMTNVSEMNEINWNVSEFYQNEDISLRISASDNHSIFNEVSIKINVPKRPSVDIEKIVKIVDETKSVTQVIEPTTVKEEIIKTVNTDKVKEAQKYFEIIAPNGGEKIASKKTTYIMWETLTSINSVDIYYTLDGGKNWILVESSLKNNGQFIWKAPSVTKTSKQCKIKVQQASTSKKYDTSDAFFTITK